MDFLRLLCIPICHTTLTHGVHPCFVCFLLVNSPCQVKQPLYLPVPPTPADTPGPSVTILSGSSTPTEKCVSSPYYPSNYGSSQTCSIRVGTSGYISSTTVTFNTESCFCGVVALSCCDILTIESQRFQGNQGPSNVAVTAASTISMTFLSKQNDLLEYNTNAESKLLAGCSGYLKSALSNTWSSVTRLGWKICITANAPAPVPTVDTSTK